MIHALAPLSEYPSSAILARVLIPVMSEPACASDSAYAPSRSPASIGASSSACWSGVPNRCRAWQLRMCTATPTPTLIHADAISSSACRYTSYGWPDPPSSSGYGIPSTPGLAQQGEHVARELSRGLGGGGARSELLDGDLADQRHQLRALGGRQHAVDGHERSLFG